MKRFFKPFEEDEILFKIKIERECIDVYAYGYWKFSGDFFWKKLGRVSGDLWRTSKAETIKQMPLYLQRTEELFFVRMRENAAEKAQLNIRHISVADATRRLDNAST